MSNITTKPVKPTMVDTTKIKFSKINTLPNGAKIAYLNHGADYAPLFVQSPEMKVPFDSGTYYPENDSSGKYAVQVEMGNMDSDESMKDFHDMLSKMDKHIVSQGIVNSSEWFKSQAWMKKKGDPRPAEEKIADNYTNMVKVSTDPETGEPNGKWAPKFNFKVVKRDGKMQCDCYDSNKNELVTEGEEAVNLEQMFKKGTKVKMILKCKGLWISNVGWGCTWSAEQIKINTPVGFSGYAFDDSDDEDAGLELSRQSTAPPTSEKVAQDNYVEDSDDEEDGSEADGADGADEAEEDGSEGEEETKVVKRKVKKSVN